MHDRVYNILDKMCVHCEIPQIYDEYHELVFTRLQIQTQEH